MNKSKLKGRHHLEYLKAQLKGGDFVGFMLFTGQVGGDKLKTAVDFATSVLCEKSDGHTFCGECQSCMLIKTGNHPDLIHIGGDGAIKISEVRGLQKTLLLKPYIANSKVAIVRDAHTMTEESANAFLKVLEEPPENSVIILIAPDKSLLPETVVSRSQIVNFGSNVGGKADSSADEDIENDIFSILLQKEPKYQTFSLVQKYSKEKTDTAKFIDSFENILRRTLLSRYAEDKSLDSQLQEVCGRYSEKDTINILQRVEKVREYLKSNISGRFALENLIINI